MTSRATLTNLAILVMMVTTSLSQGVEHRRTRDNKLLETVEEVVEAIANGEEIAMTYEGKTEIVQF